jgi:hypothetical protein
MSEDWTAVAAEVGAGLAEAGTIATLRKRGDGPDAPWEIGDDAETLTEITVVQSKRRVRDGIAMTERTVRMLLIDPTGTVPAKGDKVAVGIAPASVTSVTQWARIAEVETVAPGGVAVLYKAMLEE